MQMAGSVWVDVLRDLELEAKENATMFADDAKYVRDVMANRTLPGRGMGGGGKEKINAHEQPCWYVDIGVLTHPLIHILRKTKKIVETFH